MREWVKDWITGDAVPPSHPVMQRVLPISSRALRWVPRASFEGSSWRPSYIYLFEGWILTHLIQPTKDVPVLGWVIDKLHRPLCYLSDVSIGVYDYVDPDSWVEVNRD